MTLPLIRLVRAIASLLQFVLTWLMNGILIYYYWLRSKERMLQLKYHAPWPAFTHSKYPCFLVLDLLLFNLTPFPDPAYRYSPGTSVTCMYGLHE
jgi:hypothetical protein